MHLKGSGASVFAHVCRLGLEGIVSKRTDAPYRSRAVEGVAQVEEPGERGSAPRARGALALISAAPAFMGMPTARILIEAARRRMQ